MELQYNCKPKFRMFIKRAKMPMERIIVSTIFCQEKNCMCKTLRQIVALAQKPSPHKREATEAESTPTATLKDTLTCALQLALPMSGGMRSHVAKHGQRLVPEENTANKEALLKCSKRVGFCTEVEISTSDSRGGRKKNCGRPTRNCVFDLVYPFGLYNI